MANAAASALHLANIMSLSGGTNMYPGIADRMQKEIVKDQDYINRVVNF